VAETHRPTHDDTPPLFPDEVARREDIAATAAIPDEIARQFARSNLVISSRHAPADGLPQLETTKQACGSCANRRMPSLGSRAVPWLD
jgi:hypothetical protein